MTTSNSTSVKPPDRLRRRLMTALPLLRSS
jgi:hypothetical protein